MTTTTAHTTAATGADSTDAAPTTMADTISLGGRFRVRRGDLISVVAVIMGLATINVTAHLTSLSTVAAIVPVGVACLLVIAKARGMTWTDLGLGRAYVGKGLKYGIGAVVLVAAVIAVALAIPMTRGFFFNESYASLRTALIAALVIIPLQTVLPVELAVRGLLHGRLRRLGGTKAVFIGGSILFGLWHVASSLSLTATNVGLTAFLGSGTAAQWIGVGLAVVATAGAGAGLTWLRHHTGSVLAPIGLHWALNAVGALAAAAAWTFL
jgi:membrane protease YdiL (CAAX protease family)